MPSWGGGCGETPRPEDIPCKQRNLIHSNAGKQPAAPLESAKATWVVRCPPKPLYSGCCTFCCSCCSHVFPHTCWYPPTHRHNDLCSLHDPSAAAPTSGPNGRHDTCLAGGSGGARGGPVHWRGFRQPEADWWRQWQRQQTTKRAGGGSGAGMGRPRRYRSTVGRGARGGGGGTGREGGGSGAWSGGGGIIAAR